MTDKITFSKISAVLISIILVTTVLAASQIFKPAYASGIGDVQVYVGYADDLRAGAVNFPTPWQGSPNINFIGGPSQWDAGAIRIDNFGSTPITIDSVAVDLNRPGPSLNLWGTFTIAPHTGTILTQTSQFNFDTSDFPFKGCGDPAAVGEAPVPTVTITSGVNSQVFSDNGHVLDTLGYDLACLQNESTPWTLIGGPTPQYSEQLFVNGFPLSGSVNLGQNVVEVASSTDVTIDHVTFHWKDPSSTEVRTQTSTGNTDSFTPNVPGSWTVCDDFISNGVTKQTVCSPFTVLALTTTTVTTSSQTGNVIPSTSVSDSATLTGSGTSPLPDLTGTINYQLCGPNPSPSITNCVAAGTVPITTPNGGISTAVSPAQSPTSAGSYCWTASYTPASGSSYTGSSSTTTTNECFNVLASTTQGRMTGGGSIIDPTIGKVTHGFELQCDVTKGPNNLQINWGTGNKFHLDSLSSAVCVNDPSIVPNPPTAGFDTYIGTGTGSYNGVSGATATWTFTDAGEPGKNDHATIVIKVGTTTVLSVSGNLDKGNQQAHNQ
jgi:hypothetical protein